MAKVPQQNKKTDVTRKNAKIFKKIVKVKRGKIRVEADLVAKIAKRRRDRLMISAGRAIVRVKNLHLKPETDRFSDIKTMEIGTAFGSPSDFDRLDVEIRAAEDRFVARLHAGENYTYLADERERIPGLNFKTTCAALRKGMVTGVKP